MMNATRGLRASTIAALLALTPASVFAADMAVRRAPPPPAPYGPPPVYNWTGFYIGGNIGGMFESDRFTDDIGDSFGLNRSGFAGGGQVGYNWQFMPWAVAGVEWTFDGTSLSSTATDLASGMTANERVDWATTVMGRLGYAANNWLFYGKGGGGWVRDRATITDGTDFFTASSTRGGWAAGAGIEYGISYNWTVGVDWTHIGFNDQTIPIDDAGDFGTFSRHFDMVTFRVNYKF